MYLWESNKVIEVLTLLNFDVWFYTKLTVWIFFKSFFGSPLRPSPHILLCRADGTRKSDRGLTPQSLAGIEAKSSTYFKIPWITNRNLPWFSDLPTALHRWRFIWSLGVHQGFFLGQQSVVRKDNVLWDFRQFVNYVHGSISWSLMDLKFQAVALKNMF